MVALVAVFLAAAWAAWFTSMRVGSEPSIERDGLQTLNDLVKSRQPPGPGAGPIYDRVLYEMLGFDGWRFDEDNALYREISEMGSGFLWTGEWDDPLRSEHHERFRRLRPLLEELHGIADAPGWMNPYVPHPSASRKVDPARFSGGNARGALQRFIVTNVTGIRAAAESEDWETLALRFRVSLTMAGHLCLHATEFEWAAGNQIAIMAIAEVMYALMDRDIPAHACEQLLAVIEETPWPPLPMHRVLEGRRLILEDAVQWLYAPGARGPFIPWMLTRYMNGRTPMETPPSLRERATMLTHQSFLAPNRAEALRMIDENFGEHALLRLYGEPMREAPGDPWAEFRRVMPEQGFRIPDAEYPIFFITSTRTRLAALRAMLHIELYRESHGGRPGALEDAVPPDARLDPVSGGRIGYQRAEDDTVDKPYKLFAPDEHPYFSTLPERTVLNLLRPPIPDDLRESLEGRQDP